jgi:Yip1 domain
MNLGGFRDRGGLLGYALSPQNHLHFRNIMRRKAREEWPVIAAEPMDISRLYTGYVMILAALPAVMVLPSLLTAGTPVGMAIFTAVGEYLASLIAVAALAVISSKLAPFFGGAANLQRAFKLAAFAGTAFFIGDFLSLLVSLFGNIFAALDVQGPLEIMAAAIFISGGIYSIVTYYQGISELMAVPAARQVAYSVVVLLATIVVIMIVSGILIVVSGVLVGLTGMPR